MDGLIPDRICTEHAYIDTLAAGFGTQAMLLVLFDNERTGIDHFPCDQESTHQKTDVPIAVADHEMPLARLHTEVQGMDQAGIPTPFENSNRFIGVDNFVSHIKTEINIGPVENNNVFAGWLLPTIQRFLTNTRPHSQSG
jgi:hypothetical protein